MNIESLYGPEYRDKYQATIGGLYTQAKYSLVQDAISQLPNNSWVLDVGCDIGLQHPLGLRNQIGKGRKDIKYFGLDVHPAFFEDGQQDHFGIVGQAERLPYQNSIFDSVLVLDVLDHIENTQGVLKEVRRVLKPGSPAIIVVPALYKLDCFKEQPDFAYINQKRLSSHVTMKSPFQWIAALRQEGFEIDGVRAFGFALSLPYLFWTDEQFVPARNDVFQPSTGVHKDILKIINGCLIPDDIVKIDESLGNKLKVDQTNLHQLVHDLYKDTSDFDTNYWPLWSIPLMLHLHPDFGSRGDLQKAEKKLRAIVVKNAAKFTPEGKTRLNYVGEKLNDNNFLMTAGGNALLIRASTQ
ncbi:class I SAM-dependent methyltransferase [Candidatus Gottesmanbacteria bacterium]|nr:class I SAM-dependent methyltransferase [Candidatus Gottesmanbacteria bacterium]